MIPPEFVIKKGKTQLKKSNWYYNEQPKLGLWEFYSWISTKADWDTTQYITYTVQKHTKPERLFQTMRKVVLPKNFLYQEKKNVYVYAKNCYPFPVGFQTKTSVTPSKTNYLKGTWKYD